MEILRMPRILENRGVTGWPKIVLIGKGELPPTNGLPYIRATSQDYALTFRVLIPILKSNFSWFDWEEIYYELVGKPYRRQPIYVPDVDMTEETGHTYGASDERTEEMTLLELAADFSSYVDINVLLDLKMIPAFLTDITDAIRINITNNFQWIDGYNKKNGLCSGYLQETGRKKSLVILDISSSIPDGLSAGMMTLIQTITEVTHADLIITGGRSCFWTNTEVREMDIHKVRSSISRSNESDMFNAIITKQDMNYENVICFGDSDNPSPVDLSIKPNIKRLYSYFVGERDRYGVSYETVTGYGRWVMKNCPEVEIHHNIEWSKCFR